VHHDHGPDPGHLGPEHGRGDHGVDHGDIGRLPLQFLGHITAELAGRPAQLPVNDPPPLGQRVAGLPVLDQIGLRMPHIVVRGVLVPQECRAGRFEPGPQPFGAQYPHLVAPRDRPPHDCLNGFHAPAAVPAGYQDLHPPTPFHCSRPGVYLVHLLVSTGPPGRRQAG